MVEPLTPPSDKTALRRRFSALRNGLTAEQRTAAEAAILARLFSLPAWREAPLVCGYVSVRGELDTDPIWRRAAAEGKAYDEMIKELGGIDLQLLGIGLDGHIGFNEPDDCFTVETHPVELDESTIEANARFFASKEEVPTTAITMGMLSIYAVAIPVTRLVAPGPLVAMTTPVLPVALA